MNRVSRCRGAPGHICSIFVPPHLRRFIDDHDLYGSNEIWPETEAVAVQYGLRFRMIMDNKIETVGSLLEAENILKR